MNWTGAVRTSGGVSTGSAANARVVSTSASAASAQAIAKRQVWRRSASDRLGERDIRILRHHLRDGFCRGARSNRIRRELGGEVAVDARARNDGQTLMHQQRVDRVDGCLR